MGQSGRAAPTKSAVIQTSIGKLKAKRLSTTTSPNTVTIPVDIRWAILRNDGANKIAINFGDDASADYWTLYPGESLPCAIETVAGLDFNYQSIGGSSILEIIIWG